MNRFFRYRIVLPVGLLLAASCNGTVDGENSGSPEKAAANAKPAGRTGEPGAPAGMPGAMDPGGMMVGPGGGISGAGGTNTTAPPGAAKVGRRMRRMSADQIRAVLAEVVGFAYQGKATVRDPLAPTGYSERADADLLELNARALGKPDYDLTVSENLEPGVSFAKFVQDAVRYSCGQAAKREVTEGKPLVPPRLLLKPGVRDDGPGAEPQLRGNIVGLIGRFWGKTPATSDAEVSALLTVFRAAATAQAWTDAAGAKRVAGTSADGWRAVCIALATDPQFLVY